LKPKRARQPAATRRNFAAPLCCALMVAGLWLHTAPAASGDSSPQGDSWDSIGQLPDWDGVWALTIEGHLHAAAESDDNSAPGLAVPLTPKYSQLRHDTQVVRPAHRIYSKLKDTQEALSYCLPAGVPGIMLHTIQYEFLFTPGRVTMLTENGEVRRFYTDGRRHLSLDELTKSYEGDSIGHWEGDTLVVDTIGFPKGTLLQNGNVTSDVAHPLRGANSSEGQGSPADRQQHGRSGDIHAAIQSHAHIRASAADLHDV
jgi:hypothetical protein